MGDSDFLNQYITPMSAPWVAALTRFEKVKIFSMKNIEQHRRLLLSRVQSELGDDMMISDVVVDAYMHLMANYWVTPWSKAVYMDTMAYKKLKEEGYIDSRQLRFNQEDKNIITHVLWPIHHPGLHWSLVVCCIRDTTIISFDSLIKFQKHTLEACRRIREFWIAQMVHPQQISDWEYDCPCNREGGLVQATGSNDCGPLMLLAMRMVRTGIPFPALAFSRNDRDILMRTLAKRMRQRITAELLAEQINPGEHLIPCWLTET